MDTVPMNCNNCALHNSNAGRCPGGGVCKWYRPILPDDGDPDVPRVGFYAPAKEPQED
jgi:hypothetical protein